MHEEALFADLRRRLLELDRDQGPGRIVRVRLWVGALSHLSETTLRSRWPVAMEGTPAAGAALEVEESRDPTDPRAQGVVLTSVTFDDGPGP